MFDRWPSTMFCMFIVFLLTFGAIFTLPDRVNEIVCAYHDICGTCQFGGFFNS